MILTEKPLKQIELWIDEKPRSGPENMAIDECLLETSLLPVLRVYAWEGDWASLGCFERLDEARKAVSIDRWVRRLTGGGVVDHRADWTYTLFVPAGFKLSRMKGAESYQVIHKALAGVLSDRFKLVDGFKREKHGSACFENPVTYDIIDVSSERKIAGAGQRRTKFGLLHQGSVAGIVNNFDSIKRSLALANALSESWEQVEFETTMSVIEEKIAARYGNAAWTERR